MATKSHVHKGKCGPCCLCKKESTKYVHAEKMDTQVSQLISKIEQFSLSNEACVCHACYKQTLRNVANPNFHPRWKPKQPTPKIICAIVDCTNIVYRKTNIASPEKIESIVGHKLSTHDSAAGEATAVGTPLCQDHYICVHSSLHARQPCEYCGCKPKWGEKEHYRHCSSPKIVIPYLNVISSGETCMLTATSNICMPCYQFFNGITKHSGGKGRGSKF